MLQASAPCSAEEEDNLQKTSQSSGMSEDQEAGYEDDDEDEDDTEEIYGPAVEVEHTVWMPKVYEEATFRTTQLIFKKKQGKTITRLRQPRDLYALSKTVQVTPRYPSEMQVLSGRPEHILYTPPQREPLWKTVKDGRVPQRSSDICGKVVYDNSPDPEIKYFGTSKVGGKVIPPRPYYILQGVEDKTLVFESRFECGNLMRAIKVGELEYELWLRFDLYTKKHTQWFYFRVQNARANVQYRFTIMNFLKSGSLYNDGMRPLMYSEQNARNGVGWVRTGSNIKYYKNNIKVEEGRERCYYSLTWTCTFPNHHDTYYFAHSYPFTYSDLKEYLSFLDKDSRRRRCCTQRVLCRSLAGNQVYILTVTAPAKNPKEAAQKKYVVVTARVHPGETISSWMMKGVIDFLTSEEPLAIELRNQFIFKIIPMLNPDGVIVGNYRCSLSGRDLNRNYKTVLKESFPSVWHTRGLIKKLQEEREVVMYCDLHGHSRKKNIFMYGCQNKTEKSLNARLFTRVFPLLVSKEFPEKFSFRDCRFKVHKSKEGTGRVVMWNIGIKNSFTMEASFCSSSHPDLSQYHFCMQDYEEMGYHFCYSLVEYTNPNGRKVNSILLELQDMLKEALLSKLGEQVEPSSDSKSYDILSESDTAGSDSSVSDGLPMQILHASVPEMSKKKRLKTRKERNRKLEKKKSPSPKDSKAEIAKKNCQSCPEISKKKVAKKTSQKSAKMTRIKFTSKGSPSLSDPQPVSSFNHEVFNQRIPQTYIQAGLFDATPSSVRKVLKTRPRSCTSCMKCTPQYYIAYDSADGEKNASANKNIYIPKSETNEFPKRAHAYDFKQQHNLANPSGRIYHVGLTNRNTLLQRQTVNQGDNIQYLNSKLKNIKIEEYSPNGSHEISNAQNLFGVPKVTSAVSSFHNDDTTQSTPVHNRVIASRVTMSPPDKLRALVTESRRGFQAVNRKERISATTKPYQSNAQSPIRSHSIDLDLTQPRSALTSPFKRRSTSADHNSARSAADQSVLGPRAESRSRPDSRSEKTTTEEKIRDRLVTFGGSGTLVNLAISVNQTKNKSQTVTVTDASSRSKGAPTLSRNSSASYSTGAPGHHENDTTASNVTLNDTTSSNLTIKQSDVDSSGQVVVNLNMNISPHFMKN